MIHVIADVHFEPGVADMDAPLTCSCGWEGVLWDWDKHKKDAKTDERIPEPVGRGRGIVIRKPKETSEV